MATATNSPGKTVLSRSFSRTILKPTSKAVNEAWTAAGMKGTISHTVVSKTEATGADRQSVWEDQESRRGKGSHQDVRDSNGTPGKTSFVKEFLQENPHGNAAAVNEAWAAAGIDGTISPTLVNKMRASLGLTGNLRGNRGIQDIRKREGNLHGQEKRKTSEGDHGCGQRTWWATTRRKSRHSPERPRSRIDRLIFKVDGDWRPHRDRGLAETGKTAALRSVDPRLICPCEGLTPSTPGLSPAFSVGPYQISHHPALGR